MAVEISTKPVKQILDRCQQVLGYCFKNSELLRGALTHTSSANTRQASNERLEFLGDSVLGLITCETLFLDFPEYQEGDMTKIKSSVVSRDSCARFSQEIGLGDFLFLGRGMKLNPAVPSNLLADVFESIVAAIYLDGGMEAVKPFVCRFVKPEIERVIRDVAHNNYKSLLQQIAQRDSGDTPRYEVLDEQGPDHARSFKIAVVIGTRRFAAAWGQNKKSAESRAAKNALAELNGEPIPHNSDF